MKMGVRYQWNLQKKIEKFMSNKSHPVLAGYDERKNKKENLLIKVMRFKLKHMFVMAGDDFRRKSMF